MELEQQFEMMKDAVRAVRLEEQIASAEASLASSKESGYRKFAAFDEERMLNARSQLHTINAKYR